MALTRERIGKFRRILEAMDGRVLGDLRSLEEQARTGLGGEAGGNLSGAPMHLADLGTEQYMQELNATLLENESYIRLEIRDALARLDRDAYGICERCGKSIIVERLEALPYTRYCTPCSAEVGDGATANLNVGRPDAMDGLERRHGVAEVDPTALGDGQPFTGAASRGGRDNPDV